MAARARQRRAARLERVLEYIDAHPGETFEVEFLSGLANISPFHFHRVLSAYLGESVSAYVRRRTLERAARRLLLDGASVTACSASAGYASSSAFARAFRRQFDVCPRDLATRLRARRAASAAYLPCGLEYRRLAPMEVVAIRRFGAHDQAAPAAWSALQASLHGAALEPGQTLYLGVPSDWPELTPEPLRRYEACARADLPPSAELFAKHIAGGDYAVFQYCGPFAGLPAAHQAVLWSWYPRSGTRLREVPAFHLLTDPSACTRPDADVVGEIFLPIERPATSRARVGQAVLARTATAFSVFA